MAISEIFCLILMYLRHLNGLRLAALAHPFAFHLPPMPWIMRALGTVPSTYEAASAALEDGATVLVFPGGDHEATRPFWRADVVDFNRRKGFLKIARDANVPIVPMGIENSHWSVPVLWRSRLVLPYGLVLPWLFGLKRYPLTLLAVLGAAAIVAFGVGPLGWPATLALAWLWLASPYTMTPIVPVSIRFRVGAPIPPEELFASDDLEAAYDRVEGAVQSLVTPERTG